MIAMIGIDTSKSKLDCALMQRDEVTPLWQRDIANQPEGYMQILRETPPNTPWVIEPTGRYSLGVVQFAVAAGQKILLALPARPRPF